MRASESVQIHKSKTQELGSSLIGVFKGMGDLLSAAPVVISELDAGLKVVLLVFPAVGKIVDLIDWGEHSRNLNVLTFPAKTGVKSALVFLRRMAGLSPSFVWISPHAPRAARSLKVPLCFWIFKLFYWRDAKLAGVDSERMSRLFDMHVPVDRNLPLEIREWTAYAMLRRCRGGASPQARFRPSVERNRLLTPLFDILIHPGANADNRKWPVEHFVELITLLPSSCRVGLVGLPADIEGIRSSLPDNERVQCVVGSLEEAIIGIARTRVLLSMDSGTTFFAKALRVPTIALYGPVDPVTVINPDEGGVLPIYERRWACQPCGDSRCRYSVNYCMRAIEPERVARELLRLLQGLDQKVPIMIPVDEERHASDR